MFRPTPSSAHLRQAHPDPRGAYHQVPLRKRSPVKLPWALMLEKHHRLLTIRLPVDLSEARIC